MEKFGLFIPKIGDETDGVVVVIVVQCVSGRMNRFIYLCMGYII